MLTPDSLICEYFTNPIGIDVSKPRLSWQSTSEQRGARQTAYQIQVNERPNVKGGNGRFHTLGQW